MNLSLVIPCYNEAGQIKVTFQKLAEFTATHLLDKLTALTVIAVDDGSQDDTWTDLLSAKQDFLARKEFKELDTKIKLLSFSRNFGKEAAILAGLSHVAKDCTATVVLDADLQHPLSLIPKMIDCYQRTGADVIDAVKKDRGDESGLNRLFANGFYKFFDKHSRIKLQDMADFKLISQRVREQILAMPEPERFFRGQTSWLGFKHAEVFFVVEERAIGVSKWSFTSKINLANDIFFGYSKLPELGQLILTGIACALFALQIIYWFIACICFAHPFTKLDYLIFLVLLTFVSVMLSKLWQTEYLARIYRASQKRPLYIVEKEA